MHLNVEHSHCFFLSQSGKPRKVFATKTFLLVSLLMLCQQHCERQTKVENFVIAYLNNWIKKKAGTTIFFPSQINNSCLTSDSTTLIGTAECSVQPWRCFIRSRTTTGTSDFMSIQRFSHRYTNRPNGSTLVKRHIFAEVTAIDSNATFSYYRNFAPSPWRVFTRRSAFWTVSEWTKRRKNLPVDSEMCWKPSEPCPE